MNSPFDDHEWPTHFNVASFLDAANGDLTIENHAYFSDVARCYSYHETLFLILCNRLPDERESRLFDACLKCNISFSFRKAAWLAGLTCLVVNKDPVISACVASLATSDEVLDMEEEISQLFAYFLSFEQSEAGGAAHAARVPAAFEPARTAEEEQPLALLQACLDADGWQFPGRLPDMNVTGLMIACLFLLGCRSVPAVKFLLLFSSLPLVFRELNLNKTLTFHSYPANTPPYDYVAPKEP